MNSISYLIRSERVIRTYTYPVPERGRWGLSEAVVAADVKRPILCTQYNHSLGTAFEGLQDH